MDSILNIQTLWEGYDPNAEPLDIVVLKQTKERSVLSKYLYFTGRELKHGKSRVFGALYSKGACENKPAVLVVHDYDYPIDEKILEDLARRGFVAMSVDYAGRREIGLHTLYPEEIDYCNHDVSKAMFEITQTARETKLYEYAVNSRRAISYLLNVEKVSSVSVLTFSKGVYVGAIVLGVDKRVKNGAVLFGNIHRNFPAPTKSDVGTENEVLARQIAYDLHRQMWEVALAPQNYALQIKAPVYFVNSANSPFVDVVDASKTFLRVNGDSRMLILPTTVDYLPSKYTKGVVEWLKGYEAPARSEIKSFIDEGGNYCLRVVTNHPFEQTSLWYCTDAEGKAKSWIKADLVKTDNGYVAKPVTYERDCNIAAFAFFNGEVATTTPIHLEKVSANYVKKTLGIIFSGTGKQNLVPMCQFGEVWDVDLEPKLGKGDLGIVGAQGKSLATFALSEKINRANSSLTLCFDVCCKVRQQLKITAVSFFGSKNDTYRQETEILGNGKWERKTIEKIDFHRVDDGRQLTESEHIDMLIFSADSEFILNNIFLV